MASRTSGRALSHALVKESSNSSTRYGRGAPEYGKPLDVIEGPLMSGMNVVGTCSAGQNVPATGGEVRTFMKKPLRSHALHGGRKGGGRRPAQPRIVMATVKGDSHIGKNISG